MWKGVCEIFHSAPFNIFNGIALTTWYFVFQPPLPEIDYSQIDVISLLKEKVRLEGQLEMVDMEAKQAIKDRAELQTQVCDFDLAITRTFWKCIPRL